MKIDVSQEVKSLVEKAAKAEKPDEAMKYSQAACNAANAMACLHGIAKMGEKPAP